MVGRKGLSKIVVFFIAAFFIFSVKVNANAESTEKVNTQITLTHSVGRVGPSSPYNPITTGIEISLKDEGGNVLEGKKIEWEGSGVVLTENNTVTDSKGISSSRVFIGHADRTYEFKATLLVKFIGDEKYSDSSLKVTLDCFDVGPPTSVPSSKPTEIQTPQIIAQTPAQTPPPPSLRPATPDVKRKPGPTEVDMIRCATGRVVNGDKPVGYADLTIEGEPGIGKTDGHGEFNINTVYTCGKLIVSKKGYISRDVQLEYYNTWSIDHTIELFGGDINSDAAINMVDVLGIAKYFNCSNEEKQFDPICDLTNDNFINMADVMIIAKNFGKTSADYDRSTSISKVGIDLTIDQPKGVTQNSVFLKGGIYRANDYFITPVWIEYWEATSPNDVIKTDSDMIFYSPDFIARDINGLKPSTKYFFRVSSGIGSSEIGTFTTLAN